MRPVDDTPRWPVDLVVPPPASIGLKTLISQIQETIQILVDATGDQSFAMPPPGPTMPTAPSGPALLAATGQAGAVVIRYTDTAATLTDYHDQ